MWTQYTINPAPRECDVPLGNLRRSGIAWMGTVLVALSLPALPMVRPVPSLAGPAPAAAGAQVLNPTTTQLSSSRNPSTLGQPVTFTATVTSNAAAGNPTGSVTFFDGGAGIGEGTLSGEGVATFTTSSLAVGSHTITAKYNGDDNFSSSTSTPLTQVVNDVTPSPAPSTATSTPPPRRTPSPATTTPSPTLSTSPASTASPPPSQLRTPTSTPICPASKPNRVRNPGFESVTGPGTQRSYWQGGRPFVSWDVLEAATSKVPHWTQAESSLQHPMVTGQGGLGSTLVPFDAKYALLPGYHNQAQGLIGVLSSPTTAGATYQVSAKVAKSPPIGLHSVEFALRLRKSVTGALSASLVAIPLGFQDVDTWFQLTGMITADTDYDQVLLTSGFQYGPGPGQNYGLVDDVGVCGATNPPEPTTWGLRVAIGVALVGLILGAVIVFLLRRGRNARAKVSDDESPRAQDR